jgi:hypothetical protein
MKTITQIMLMLVIALMLACQGEPGIPGEDGIDGDSFLGSVFEIKGDFKPSNDFSLYFEFPKTIEVFESDVVLVYILWDQVEGNSGKVLDVWRLLPQTVVLNDGILQYNFDYTWLDVQIFLGGSIDFNTLLPSEALDQIFRIVVLPAYFAKNNVLDVYDFNLLMKTLRLNSADVQMVNFADIEKIPAFN